MATKKPKGGDSPKKDARKPFRMVRLKQVLADVADAHAEELAQDLTQYVSDAVRMRLTNEGRWPPRE